MIFLESIVKDEDGHVDWRIPFRPWRSNKADAFALVVTFVAVSVLGIEIGVLVGMGTSLALFLWRTSRPYIAVVGQVGNSESFRNVQRHEVTTHPAVLAIRVEDPNRKRNNDALRTQATASPLGRVLTRDDRSTARFAASARDQRRV